VKFPELAGGGTDNWKCALQPWPYYSQNADWTTDQDGFDENANLNCGPESICMCCKYLTGIETPADYVKDVILGPEKTGTTTAANLAWYLRHMCEIPTDIIGCSVQDQFTWYVWEYLHRGKPVIWLRYWDYVGSSTLHWACLNYMDSSKIGEADPWTGTYKSYSYADAWAWGGNTMLGLHRVRWDA
jgi:hypothetical protein